MNLSLLLYFSIQKESVKIYSTSPSTATKYWWLSTDQRISFYLEEEKLAIVQDLESDQGSSASVADIHPLPIWVNLQLSCGLQKNYFIGIDFVLEPTKVFFDKKMGYSWLLI